MAGYLYVYIWHCTRSLTTSQGTYKKYIYGDDESGGIVSIIILLTGQRNGERQGVKQLRRKTIGKKCDSSTRV